MSNLVFFQSVIRKSFSFIFSISRLAECVAIDCLVFLVCRSSSSNSSKKGVYRWEHVWYCWIAGWTQADTRTRESYMKGLKLCIIGRFVCQSRVVRLLGEFHDDICLLHCSYVMTFRSSCEFSFSCWLKLSALTWNWKIKGEIQKVYCYYTMVWKGDSPHF